MRDQLYVITQTGRALAEWWYITAAVLLLFLLVTRRTIATQPDSIVSTLRSLRWLLVWPAVALAVGLVFTDVDENSQALPMLLMGAIGALFLANLVHAVVELWRQRSRWGLVGSGVLLELWMSFCIALSSAVTISGIGRHWL